MRVSVSPTSYSESGTAERPAGSVSMDGVSDASPGPSGIAGFARARPVLACWLLLGTVTTVPYVTAAVLPPPGRSFAGTFHWIDDFYSYVSFAQQAEDGSFLFVNKLALEPHEPALVNLEWWLVGRLSRLLGRSPFVAFRVFALLVLLGLLLAAARALARAGLPAPRMLPALLLVAAGGGLGGLLFELTPRPLFRCADLATGIFPFVEILSNPHWLAGTWLLLETILVFDPTRSAAGNWRALAFASVLGLVRPYDLVLAAAVLGSWLVLRVRGRDRLRSALTLAGLAPVALYNYWVFYVTPGFGSYFGTGTRYATPPRGDYLWALGPAALLALVAAVAAPARDEPQRDLRFRLWTWAVVAGLVIVVQPVSFSQQFAVGAGLPLLLLAAPLFARLRPALAVGLLAALATTAAVALRVVSRSEPAWHVPSERRQAALAMRATCRPGDLAFSPPDIGLYTVGLTACRAFVSHPWAPQYVERAAQAESFYRDMPPSERLALLERWRVTHLVLPGDAGPSAEGWLGEASRFEQIARLGPPPGLASVYLRPREASGAGR